MNIDRLTILNVMLETAREYADQSNHAVAVGLFERVLRDLEQMYGPSSMRLTPVLAELRESYDQLGCDLKAQECSSRLSSVLQLICKSA